MSEPKLLSDEDLTLMLDDLAITHPFTAQSIRSHIAALGQDIKSYGKNIIALIKDRDSLKAELAEAKRDSARLDWLEKNPDKIVNSTWFNHNLGWLYNFGKERNPNDNRR